MCHGSGGRRSPRAERCLIAPRAARRKAIRTICHFLRAMRPAGLMVGQGNTTFSETARMLAGVAEVTRAA